jgi:molybdate transport system substrate-binding protein
MRSRLPLLVSILVLGLAACSNGSASSAPSSTASVGIPTTAPSSGPAASPSSATAASPGAPASLTIYAASSLSGALSAAKTAYTTANPGTILTISTDASSALETQIEQGAPADLFLSADTTNPKKLVDGGFTVGPAVDFAGNKLTVIVPSSNPAKIATPADLAKSGVKVIAAGDAVPITKYADMLVDNLAAQPGYPANFAAAYGANIVSREDNVKAVVAKLELGEGDAAIVYFTDAKASSKVGTVDVPDAANVLATYAGVVLKSSPDPTAAKQFLDWFAGPDGQAILAGFGFLPPT